MNRTLHTAALCTLALPLALASAALSAQMAPMPGMTPPQASGPASETLQAYTRLKPNVLKAADKMPDADFQFKPTPEIRTYARIVNHITEAQFTTCSTLNGTKVDTKPPSPPTPPTRPRSSPPSRPPSTSATKPTRRSPTPTSPK